MGHELIKNPFISEKPFRVLTLDGGGMRGLYTATLLAILAKRFDRRFHDQEGRGQILTGCCPNAQVNG